MSVRELASIDDAKPGEYVVAPCRGCGTLLEDIYEASLSWRCSLCGEKARIRAEGARDEMEAICAWLDTLPWKGPGSLHPGEMIENIRRGAHRRGRES